MQHLQSVRRHKSKDCLPPKILTNVHIPPPLVPLNSCFLPALEKHLMLVLLMPTLPACIALLQEVAVDKHHFSHELDDLRTFWTSSTLLAPHHTSKLPVKSPPHDPQANQALRVHTLLMPLLSRQASERFHKHRCGLPSPDSKSA